MLDRATRYLDKCPPAIEPGRNDALNKLAYQVLERFDLPQSDFERLMLDWAGRCNPPMTETEALKTIHSAWAGAHRSGVVGSKARLPHNAPMSRPIPTYHPMPKSSPEPKQQAARYDVANAGELPEPITDGARALIRACYEPGEGIRIVNARLADDGGEAPDGAGPCLSREEWLRKLDAVGGDPNGIFKSTKRTGIYICLNPLTVGGSKDADVTSYRHALVEFDAQLSPEEQYRLYQESQLPCAAIIYSGGKSVHAWVRIDAQDRREYDERVSLLYSHFADAGFDLDQKNKNPGRLSRLPNCERFDRRQELLALGVGCVSFTDWVKQIDRAALGKPHRIKDLLKLDTHSDPNCVIGFRDKKTIRYLCRGKSGWLLGPSGIGKSSLVIELAAPWALGKDAFGITPARELKSLVIQAENDLYDMAEMIQGIARAHAWDDFSIEAIHENLWMHTQTRLTGERFTHWLQRVIDLERPDIVWIDPLLSFAGIDVTRQDHVTYFLRELLTPVLESTGVVMIGVHHTGKPKSMKETQHWTAIDWAYQGLGSSELVNWARAVMLLRPISDSEFELKLAKRGRRAGATNPDGSHAMSLWLRHGKHDIRWEQMEPPKETTAPAKEPKQTKVDALAGKNLHEVLAGIPSEGESANSLGERFYEWAIANHAGIAPCISDCRCKLLVTLKARKQLDRKGKLWFRGLEA
jgi:hypothetical protein